MEKSILTEEIKEKWAPVMEAEGVAAIDNTTVRNNTIRILENTEKALREDNTTATVGDIATPFGGAGDKANYDPVLFSMVRRAMPVLVANDIMGVQPMTGPTGLVFAMNSVRGTQGGAAGTDIWNTTGYQHGDTSGDGAGAGMATLTGENLGVGETVTELDALGTIPVEQANPWNEVSFDISKTAVTAKTRALKSRYSLELAQDLKSVHGLDAENELAALLSSEIVTEMNREVVTMVNNRAIVGSQGTAIAGTFNVAVDTDARWQIEAYKSLYFQIEREANAIGKATGRGKANILIVSPDVASALEASQKLDTAPLGGNIVGGWTGISFAGVLNGKYKVYIDPYAASDYITLGYKGASTYDAGLFYCPYVPLQMLKSQGEEDFAPRIGFKARYGMVANPFVGTPTDNSGTGASAANQYYRTFAVTNLAVTH